MPERVLAIEHLKLRMRPINRALRAAVVRQAGIASKLVRPDVTPLCVTGEQVENLLDSVEELLRDDNGGGRGVSLDAQEMSVEQQLRELSDAEGLPLPFDSLTETLDLSDFEQEAVLLCIAPELDRSYERIYAYILDDLNRRYPCVELLSSLTATSLTDRLCRRNAFGPVGGLRRKRVLQAFGHASTEMRQELRTAPAVFEFLTGASRDLTDLFRDPSEMGSSALGDLPPTVDFRLVERLGNAFRGGSLGVLGVWGSRHSHPFEMAIAIATASDKRLRQWRPPQAADDQADTLYNALQTASALNSMLWIETDQLNEGASKHLSETVAGLLATVRVPLILTGTDPWRPTRLLEARAYAEIELDDPTVDSRKLMWRKALPEVNKERLDEIAARYRVCGAEVRAAANVAKTEAIISSNGHAVSVADRLETACSTVTRRHTHRFGVVVKPRRGPGDLILPNSLHKRIIEVAEFYKACPTVSEEWGFGRLMTGGGGIKALFTGESGTGKTLAAEVIAGLLGMPLLKVDLSRVTSKWIGETEQNLEAAFREAEDNHAVLFFDEADALFGKRGEIQRGTDRYANLEVSYLLQRLEDYSQICICSSNLKDSIDPAFTRRFQIVLHLPRPEPPERRRIWELAFPKSAPLDRGVDLDFLAELDLTGAGIVSSAQTAALLAVESSNSKGDNTGAVIAMSHIVRAITRQYRREARLLSSSALGPYAELMNGAE